MTYENSTYQTLDGESIRVERVGQQTPQERILSAANLGELRDLLNEFAPDSYPENILASLPTFGGPAPRDTQGIYSWDERNILVPENSRTGASEWTIVPRPEA